MIIAFESIVRKYNNRGVGFIYLPGEHQNNSKVGQQVQVSIESKNSKVIFFSRLRKTHKIGIYIPAEIASYNKLLNQLATITITEVDGFFAKVSDDGIIYIPQQKAQELKLKQNEIILIEGIVDSINHNRLCQVKIREKQNTTEYFCTFNKEFGKKEGIFSIKSIVSRNKQETKNMVLNIIKDFNYASLDKNKIVAFHGKRVPITINLNIHLKEIAYFLGCYFSDGTKKGNSWGICASTPEQARYFLQRHNFIIENPILKMELTYTDPLDEDSEKLKEKLSEYWLEKANVNVPKERIWIYKTETKDAQNRNKYGALSIREHRQLVLLYYNKLLNCLIEEIIKNENKELALDFLCGVLEGDGAPSAKARGHVVIATNEKEAQILQEVFKVANFRHRGYDEEENRWYLRIGSLELIRNMPYLKDKLFQYYPKRRKLLQERLANTGCAQFLLKGTKTSNTVIGKLKENGILEGDNELTKFGKEVQASLREFMERV
ncbi:MAG: hypothetical protein Q8R47_00450 [Nanoarchaeota archaeon]|nr:hypothetical protein [Nanoarchaeota archaeon]